MSRTESSPDKTKSLFNCLICCAGTNGGVFSGEFEKAVLFDFLCGMLNVELTEEYSWDFNEDHFPLCLRCTCVIQDMFQIQTVADTVELEVLEQAEKMKQTIFDCVQLKRKQMLKAASANKAVTKTFQDDPRFEFFRNQVIEKNSEQLKNSSINSSKITIRSPETVTGDSTRPLSSNYSNLLTNLEKIFGDSDLFNYPNQDSTIFSEILDNISESVDFKETDFFAFTLCPTESDSEDIDEFLEDSHSRTEENSPNVVNSCNEEDALPQSPWPSLEDWEKFSLPIVSNKESDKEEINSSAEDDALYQALINENRKVDIGPLLDKANLSSCSFSYEENFVPQSTVTHEIKNSETLENGSSELEKVSNPSSNDSCEVITITDTEDNQESDDDCTILETNNNGKESTRNVKKTQKYSKTTGTKQGELNIVLTTHSIVTDANNPEGNTNIVIEQKTPIQVRSGIFMTVNGVSDTWQCILCGKIVRNFKNHKAVHFPGQFHCNLCSAVFKRKDNLLAHHKSKH